MIVQHDLLANTHKLEGAADCKECKDCFSQKRNCFGSAYKPPQDSAITDKMQPFCCSSPLLAWVMGVACIPTLHVSRSINQQNNEAAEY